MALREEFRMPVRAIATFAFVAANHKQADERQEKVLFTAFSQDSGQAAFQTYIKPVRQGQQSSRAPSKICYPINNHRSVR